jgi:DNA primase
MFNHATLLKETDTPAIIVEGVFDAIAFWPDAVAVLGKPTPAQVYALASARRPIAVVLDGDAWEEGEMLALKLRFEGQRAGSVHLPPRVDPDEVDRDWLRAEARSSLGASQ